ncbi:MAG: hypothetical protein ACXVLQ_03940 [Bacteriovorax sp.]
MKNSILAKFGNVFNDLRNFLTFSERPAQQQPVPKIQEPKPSKKNAPQRMANDRKKRANTKDKSMVDSQGITKFSGSGYNGKGNVSNSKIRSNRKRR